MKRIFLYLVIATLVLACTDKNESDKKAQITKIENLEKEMFESVNKHSDELGENVLQAYADFYNNYPKDQDAAEYMFRAANMARALKRYPVALDLYEKIVTDYPDYKNAVPSAFLIAFVYDNDLNDKNKARELYNKFIAHYPENKFAQDATERLKTLHMTDAELMEYFEKLRLEREAAGSDTVVE